MDKDIYNKLGNNVFQIEFCKTSGKSQSLKHGNCSFNLLYDQF